MQEFFAAHADRLTRYQLPSYSPDFNPIEYLWRNVKNDATHLKYFADFADLHAKSRYLAAVGHPARCHPGFDGPLLRIARNGSVAVPRNFICTTIASCR